MDERDKITIDRETFKALAADSRIEILKKLEEHKLTLTDLTKKLDMSPSTVKEHLDRLASAGLIEPIPGDTKWKYYRLTRKGRNILNPYETKVWFALALLMVALVGVIYNLFGRITALNFFVQNEVDRYAGEGVLMLASQAQNETNEAMTLMAKSADFAGTTTTTLARIFEAESPKITQVLSGIPLAEVMLALFLTLVIGLCVGILLKNRRFF